MKKTIQTLKKVTLLAAVVSLSFLYACSEDDILGCNCGGDTPFGGGSTCHETLAACESAEGDGECKRCD